MRKYLIPCSFIFLLVALSCSQKPEPAIPAVYYITFKDTLETELSKQILSSVPPILEKNDYVLTEESGRKGWPFYLKLTRGEQFPKDSLAPPHTTVHILNVSSEVKPVNEGYYYKMPITILQASDSIIEVKCRIFKPNDKNGWDAMVDYPSYKFVVSRFDDEEELMNRIAETITRNTFK